MAKIKHNKMQQKAINHLEGPLLILAGAGSGKTRTLTSRIANIIARQDSIEHPPRNTS